MAQALRPLRGGSGDDQNDPYHPEALLISALLEQGTFNPEHHHVPAEAFEAWRKLYDFCREYQDTSGVAPPLSVVSHRFPEFDLIPDVAPAWAAGEVLKAHGIREFQRSQGQALLALRDEDLDGAYAALDGLTRPRTHRKPPVDAFDDLDDEIEVAKIPVPYPTLMRATRGGIAAGELWFLAARLGVGKTWMLTQYAACAAKMGYKVGIHSLEMPSKLIVDRVRAHLCGGDAQLFAHLNSKDRTERKKAIEKIIANTPGKISVVDPSHGKINSVDAVADSAAEYDLVLVDHAGLLMTSDNKRAIDDWRAMALISNVLREITLSSDTPILAAAQANREAEHGSPTRPPKASNLSQSDALGQDADVLVTMTKPSSRWMVHSAEKVRNGVNLKWHSIFDPERNRFHEISKERALELKAADADVDAEFD